MKCIDAINQFTCVPLTDYNKIANGREQISGMDWCVIGCDVMWFDVMKCNVMRCDVMRCDVMWCGEDVMRSGVMRCKVMWCDEFGCDEMWCDAGLVQDCFLFKLRSTGFVTGWIRHRVRRSKLSPKGYRQAILPFFYEGNCSGLFLPPDSSTKPSYLVPVIVVAVVALVCVAVLLAFKLRARRQRNGRMKLTEKHADTLPHPYPEEKTFENPIYQVSKKRGVCNLNTKKKIELVPANLQEGCSWAPAWGFQHPANIPTSG